MNNLKTHNAILDAILYKISVAGNDVVGSGTGGSSHHTINGKTTILSCTEQGGRACYPVPTTSFADVTRQVSPR